MGDLRTSDNTSWYAIRTHLHQKDRADSNLKARGLETLNPKIKERRLNQFTGAPTYFTKSLFPRYMFARFQASTTLQAVSVTRGVHSIVRVGSDPAPVQDDVIALIKSRLNEDGFVKTDKSFKAGDKVLVKAGVLKSLVGIFEGKTKADDRVMILLEAIKYQGHVRIERSLLEKV
jgi:transcription elongation factor/antiterminator RfaH